MEYKNTDRNATVISTETARAGELRLVSQLMPSDHRIKVLSF